MCLLGGQEYRVNSIALRTAIMKIWDRWPRRYRPWAEVVQQNTEGEGPLALHRAIADSQWSRLTVLAEAGTDLNVCDPQGDTPLHLAVNLGEEEGVKLLIRFGADQTAPNAKGLTPLMAAILKGKKSIIALLLHHHDANKITATQLLDPEHQKQWEQRNGILGQDALYLVIRQSWTPLLKALLELDVNLKVNVRDNIFATPLHWAATQDDPEIVRLLIAQGAKIEACDTRGQTPLAWASLNGNTLAFNQLLAGGANPWVIDNELRNLMHFAACGQCPAIFEKLLGLGVDPLATDSYGENAFEVCLNEDDRGKFMSLWERFNLERSLTENSETTPDLDINESPAFGL